MDDQKKLTEVKGYLLSLLSRVEGYEAIEWLKLQRKRIQEDPSALKLFMAFSQASRYFKKNKLNLNKGDLVETDQIVQGFRPDTWDQLQTARTFLLLNFPAKDADHFVHTLDKIFETADLHEQEALYAALPLFPYPESLRLRAAEGLRTNITSVFDATALDNPYPARYLEEDAWNQMVLKAVFMQRPLYKIIGSDKRANEQLARILVDFAHERWAAGRSVMPELWRFVGPFMTEEFLKDMQREINVGKPLGKSAVLLACSMSEIPAAKKLLEAHPEEKEKIKNGKLTWEKIGRQFEEGKE
jgi:hypothetical protein